METGELQRTRKQNIRTSKQQNVRKQIPETRNQKLFQRFDDPSIRNAEIPVKHKCEMMKNA